MMPAHARPWLFAISGIDGAGKSTLIARLVDRLDGRMRVSSVRPLACELGFSARSVAPAVPREKAELVLAEYIGLALVASVVQACSDDADVVICDRYALDHLANQQTFGVPPSALRWVQDCLPRPDIHLLMDTKPDVAWDRITARGGNTWQTPEFLLRAQANFLAAARGADYSVTVARTDEDIETFLQTIEVMLGDAHSART
jgi:thymidylate kinase